jgi:hypothetical protein
VVTFAGHLNAVQDHRERLSLPRRAILAKLAGTLWEKKKDAGFDEIGSKSRAQVAPLP